MINDNETSAEMWVYGQKKVKKSFVPEAHEKHVREQIKPEAVSGEEDKSKTEVKQLKRKV